ncbi:MAG: hypothetical protein WCL04_07780 [Verrucomicrobiota bacterium]
MPTTLIFPMSVTRHLAGRALPVGHILGLFSTVFHGFPRSFMVFSVFLCHFGSFEVFRGFARFYTILSSFLRFFAVFCGSAAF